MKTVSYSQYSMFKNCPHQWYLTYVEKHDSFKPSVHLIFGTAFHETLQKYIETMFNESVKEAEKLHLPSHFKTKFINLYQAHSARGHFSTPEELTEFYEDAVAILDFIKKKRKVFFSTKNTELVGIEIPILTPIVEGMDEVRMKGFIDLVLYDKVLDKYTIYDIKTSTRGWSDYEKKDETKISQILLYKKLFSQLKNVPESKIDVQFFIVRRKINENADFPAKRVQEFIPANGTKKVNTAFENFKSFITEVLTPQGEYQIKSYKKNTMNCKFCPFADKPELCDRKNS